MGSYSKEIYEIGYPDVLGPTGMFDKDKCIGCSKCVKGCQTFGNGSLYLQVDHAYCVNCNQCAIAKACPSNAFVRLPSDKPYLFKGLQVKKDSKGS